MNNLINVFMVNPFRVTMYCPECALYRDMNPAYPRCPVCGAEAR